jgi:SAM-dependent methyltransferase
MRPDYDLHSLYGEDYFCGRGFDNSNLIQESREPNPAFVARRLYWLGLLRAAVGGPGQLLDIGCGAGALLDVGRESGWRVEGQEISSVGAAEGRSKGHVVRVGELADCGFNPQSFDAATMIEVIEHLRDPRPTLAAARSYLRPGGWLLVTTGDVGSWFARFQGHRWGYIRPPGHVSYFTRQSLARVLISCGFKVTRIVATYDLAYPSLPKRPPARSSIGQFAALRFRNVLRTDQCVMAMA